VTAASPRRISIVLLAAVADNGVIGRDNGLPFRQSSDLKRFKALTMGKPVIMGRKTFESLPKVLPGRPHSGLIRNRDWTAEGAEVVHSRDEAIERLGTEPGSVIGGAEIFGLFLPVVDSIELTEVGAKPPGDTKIIDPKTRPEFSKRLIQEFENAFQQVDFLLGPVTPTTAFKIGEFINNPLEMYLSDLMTVAVDLVGNCAISLPSGEVEGLPVGLQLMGAQKADRDLLAFAKAAEELQGTNR